MDNNVIDLSAHRRSRRPHPLPREIVTDAPARFSFDVVSPFTYLAAERVERAFPGAVWCAVGSAQSTADTWAPEARRRAEHRAGTLGMPLLWPDEHAVPHQRNSEHGRPARRAAAMAASRGRGPAFAIALGRLAFCGGFDPEDPSIIAEAAVAARLSAQECLHASVDVGWDAGLTAAASRLAHLGTLPVLEVGHRAFAGEDRLAEAAAAKASLTG